MDDQNEDTFTKMNQSSNFWSGDLFNLSQQLRTDLHWKRTDI